MRGYAGRMLAVLATGTVLNTAGRVALPSMLPTVIDAFDISPTAAGLAVTAIVAGMALTQYLGGRLSDALSRKTVLVGALAGFIVGFGLLAASPTYLVLLAGAVVVGVGQGLYLPASFAELTARFPERRGRALGINAASYSFGSALGPGLAVAALAVGVWRLAFLPVVVGFVPLLLALHLLGREPYVLGAVAVDPRPTLRRLVAIPPIRRCLLAFGLVGFVWQGGLNFVPTVLQVERGFSPAGAGAVFAGLFVAGAVAAAVSGNVGDRVGYPTVAAAGVTVALAGLVVLVAVPTRPAAVAGVLLFGVGIASFWPVMDAFIIGQLPREHVAGDFGAVNTANLLVGSLGPVYVGFVAERASYAVAFGGFVVPAVAALAVLSSLGAVAKRSAVAE